MAAKAPLFQHRHYAAIAKALADTRLPYGYAKAILAELFAANNPKFDGPRFISACDGEPSNKRDIRRPLSHKQF